MRGVVTALVIAIAGVPAAGEPEHLRASLISEPSSFTPGRTTLIGLHMEMDDGWHTYWKGVNVTGFPAVIEVGAPAGWRVGETLWPAPDRYESPGGILDHVYEERVTLLIPVEVPESAQVGSVVTVRVNVEWLVCEEACIPGYDELSIRLPVTSSPIHSDERTRSLFEESRSRVPKPAGGAVSTRWDGGDLVVRSEGAARIAFYPEQDSGEITNLLERGESKGDSLRLPVGSGNRPVRGVVEVWRNERESRVYNLEVRRSRD